MLPLCGRGLTNITKSCESSSAPCSARRDRIGCFVAWYSDSEMHPSRNKSCQQAPPTHQSHKHTQSYRNSASTKRQKQKLWWVLLKDEDDWGWVFRFLDGSLVLFSICHGQKPKPWILDAKRSVNFTIMAELHCKQEQQKQTCKKRSLSRVKLAHSPSWCTAATTARRSFLHVWSSASEIKPSLSSACSLRTLWKASCCHTRLSACCPALRWFCCIDDNGDIIPVVVRFTSMHFCSSGVMCL